MPLNTFVRRVCSTGCVHSAYAHPGSLGAQTVGGNFGGGSSGAFMYFSGDKQFVVKTLTKGEMDVLHSIVLDYCSYIRSNPNTLLTKFLGAYSITMYGKDIYFTVMTNMLYSSDRTVHDVYDLKGSTVNRSASKPKAGTLAFCKHCNSNFRVGKKNEMCPARLRHRHVARQTLKDNDLKFKVRLGERREPIVDQIVQDVGAAARPWVVASRLTQRLCTRPTSCARKESWTTACCWACIEPSSRSSRAAGGYVDGCCRGCLGHFCHASCTMSSQRPSTVSLQRRSTDSSTTAYSARMVPPTPTGAGGDGRSASTSAPRSARQRSSGANVVNAARDGSAAVDVGAGLPKADALHTDAALSRDRSVHSGSSRQGSGRSSGSLHDEKELEVAEFSRDVRRPASLPLTTPHGQETKGREPSFTAYQGPSLVTE